MNIFNYILCLVFILTAQTCLGKPLPLIDFLRDQLDGDLARLTVALEKRDEAAIWEMESALVKREFPLERFRSHLNRSAWERSRKWRVVYKRVHYMGNPDLPEGDRLAEGYAVSILKTEIAADTEIALQCLWELDRKEGKWRIIGIPFWFVNAPLSLRYAGLPLTENTRMQPEFPK